MPHKTQLAALLIVLWVLCAGCSHRSSKTAAPPDAAAARARPTWPVVSSLLQEAGQAELDLGGTFVDLGAPDQHKYVRGGWLTRWERQQIENGTTFAEAHDRARLSFFAWRGGIRELQVRTRSRAVPRRCQVLLQGREVGGFTLSQTWTTARLPLAATMRPGPLELELRLDPPDAGPAQVDWIWLSRGGAKPPGRTRKLDVIRLDRPERALVGDPPRTLSYFLMVPRRGALVFDYGAEQPTEFVVQARLDGPGGPRRLFHARTKGSRWTAATVDLSSLAGRAVRLDLVTHGGAGAAGWADPELMQRGPPPRPPLRRRAEARAPRHLIQVLADAARQDAYRPFNPRSRIEAPALEQLAKGGVIFTGARATANFTLPSVGALFSGRYAWTFVEDATSTFFKLPHDLPLLPNHLRRHGFVTAAFVANPIISAPFGLGQGWDHVEILHRKFPEDASVVFGKAIEWIRANKGKRRFYLYIHTMDPHTPYHYRVGHTDRFLEGRRYTGRLGRLLIDTTKSKKMPDAPEDRRYIRALYDGEITFHDLHMGRLIAALRETGLLSETMFVYSNDHGEELFDHGRLFHAHSLAEEQLRSPLVIHAPRLFSPARVAEPVELVDLAPTATDALGLPPLPGPHGRSLLRTALDHTVAFGNAHPNTKSFPIDGAFSLKVGPLKLIRWARHQELYDVAADPVEGHDISADHPVALRLCECLLARAIASPAKDQRASGLRSSWTGGAGKAVLSPGLRRQLKALGYIQ